MIEKFPEEQMPSLIIRNITRNVREEHLKEILAKFAKVKNVEIPVDQRVNVRREYAIAEFESITDAETAWLRFDGA